MANTIRLKRRAAGGAAGAPAALKTSEPAYNEQDDTLYIGYGDDGSGNATSIRALAGAGTFATKQYVQDEMAGAGAGDMLASVYDPSNVNGDAFDQDNMVDGTTNKNFTATEKTKLAGIEVSADVTDAANVGSAINGAASKTTPVGADKLALIDSAASNALKHVTYTNLLAAIQTAVTTAIVDAAPGTLDTLNEIAAALGDDPNFATTITNALAAKAPLASPAFTGNPTAPTPSTSDDDTSVATTAFVKAAIAAATIDGGTF